MAELQNISYIHYLALFGEFFVKAHINSSSKVNAVLSSFAKNLGLRICKTDEGAQKIYSSRLKTFEMVIASFQVDYKDRKSHFFKETFLLVDISISVAFGMIFLTLSNVRVNFKN